MTENHAVQAVPLFPVPLFPPVMMDAGSLEFR